MKITVNYGNDVVCVPTSVLSRLDKATKRDIRILFVLLSSPECRCDFDTNTEKLASKCDCTVAELMSAISFWRGAGLIETDENKLEDKEAKASLTPEPSEKSTKKKDEKLEAKAQLADDLPNYSTAELNAILERHQNSAMLIDECQNIVGKLFNPHEISTIIAFQDYLDLENEYILLLMDHCSRFGKKTIHYIKKRAFTFYNEGITTAAALKKHLNKLEDMYTVEGQIRSLFGMSGRELTSKEKKYINTWICDFGYGVDVVKKAYEITVDTTQKPTPAYANAILERWHAEGLKDLAAIESAESEKLPQSGSFDTDEFFEAALKRSFNS